MGNREIKFRAWDKDLKRWAFSTEVTLEGSGQYVHHHYPKTGHQPSSVNEHQHYAGCPHIESIQLFTGLKDKNGKDIYDGDIVAITNKVGGLGKFPYDGDAKKRVVSVFWSEFRASWACKFNDHANNDLFKYCTNGETCEVIGNIYENPDLISTNTREDKDD